MGFFKNSMNNYYFGKAGKRDFTQEDLPQTRWQLFTDMLRTRFSALIRLNLMHMLVWVPAMIVAMIGVMSWYQTAVQTDLGDGTSLLSQSATEKQITAEANGETAQIDELSTEILTPDVASERIRSVAFFTLLFMIPCIAITGPVTAGVAFVTRNWARDEHAFIWSDFKDAVKENWKMGLGVSAITSILPLVGYLGWTFYGSMAANSVIYVIPQILVIMICALWAMAVTYMYPLLVTYKLRFRDVLRNAFLLAIARLPMSVGIRLLHCVPLLIAFLIANFWQLPYGIMFFFAYYLLIGFALSRFVTASFTNAVFDKYINPRIKGAEVNRGLRQDDDDDEEEQAAEETFAGEQSGEENR